MSSNPQPCRFGWTCHRADCWFAHPTGRAIDQQQPPIVAQQHAAPSPYALNPALLPQYMQLLAQPQPSYLSAPPSTASPLPYSSSITKPITSSNLDSSSTSASSLPLPASSKRPGSGGGGGGGGQAVCRYGRECHRDGCYFVHPEGRAVDERRGGGGGGGGVGRASPSDDEVADALDEFEAANGLTEDEEDEAAFRAYKASMGVVDDDDEDEFIRACQTGSAQDGGHSRAGAGAGTGPGRASGGGGGGGGGGGRGGSRVDDTWKDEWFADSRMCDCCHGYVYRCERQQPSCAQGKCFCSPQLNGAIIQQIAGV